MIPLILQVLSIRTRSTCFFIIKAPSLSETAAILFNSLQSLNCFQLTGISQAIIDISGSDAITPPQTYTVVYIPQQL